MTKREDRPIITKSIENEFMICDTCGYQDGFHTYFLRINDTDVKFNYKCPECGQKYDIGLILPLKK